MTSRIDHEAKLLRVSAECLRQLKILMDDSKVQKIAAIKLLRNETKCGLREAKIAIEKYFPGQNRNPPQADAYSIVPLITVKSITVDIGEGDVAVDLEGLHMLTLMNMNSIGMDEVRRVIELHDFIVSWEAHGTDAKGDDDE